MTTADEITSLLRGVIDPELGSDIVDLGMVRSVRVDGPKATVTIALTTAGCPLRAQIQRDVRSRVSSLPDVDEVAIEWTEMTPEEKTTAMGRARFNVSQRAEEDPHASDHRCRPAEKSLGAQAPDRPRARPDHDVRDARHQHGGGQHRPPDVVVEQVDERDGHQDGR